MLSVFIVAGYTSLKTLFSIPVIEEEETLATSSQMALGKPGTARCRNRRFLGVNTLSRNKTATVLSEDLSDNASMSLL